MKIWWKETVRWDNKAPKKVIFINPIITYSLLIAVLIAAGVFIFFER